MIRRLQKRKRERLVKPVDKTVYQRHRQWVRSLECIVPGCKGKAQFCHVRNGLPASTPSWARAGASKLPHDAFGYPGCCEHHIHDQHRHGERAFERRHGVDLLGTAMDLARRSPCPEIREFARGLSL